MLSENEDVKKIQSAGLFALEYLDNVCEKNKLTYYVCGGTLIGTIREKGFIPWDDDIDVMMPRKDYEWMLCHRKELFHTPLVACDYRGGGESDIIKAHAVIYNTSVRIIDKNSNKEKGQYCYIDIFPLDGMPEGKVRRTLHYYHAFFWRIILQISWYDSIVNQHKENRNRLERIIIYFMNHVKYRPRWDSYKILNRWHKVLSKYDINTSDLVCSLTGPCRKKEILQSRFFDKVLRMPFENIEVNVPCGYDAELRHYYGNYMIPPQNIEERELHHRMEIIGENYNEYSAFDSCRNRKQNASGDS